MNATLVPSLILRLHMLYKMSYKKERNRDYFGYGSHSDRRSQTRHIMYAVGSAFQKATMPGRPTL
jgi:hypothetical protein